MKRKYLFLLILAMLLVSCRSPEQRPTREGQLETNLSSIFRRAPVEHCRITSDTADVKGGMGNDFNTIATLNRDDVVRVLDQVGDWYVVQLDNNQVGSIDSNNATPIVREGTPGEDSPINRGTAPTPDSDVPPAQENLPIDQGNIDTLEPQGQPEDLQPGALGEQRQTTPQEQAPQRDQEQEQAQEGNITAQANQMVQLINQERERNGLPALQIDSEVARVAGVKSQDMVDNNYFSHYSPTYGSPFEMLDSFGVKYLHAGENLAGNSNVESAHVALMNSSGHRQNILNNNFTHIGIGVRRSPRYGYVYTQMFISKPR